MNEPLHHVKICPQCARHYEGGDLFCTIDGAALISSGSALIGTVIADRFLVKEKIGEGGMGEVYLAEHVRMRRRVAIKLMRRSMISDPLAISRFHREAETASQITHQNVAQVYDFGETADGSIYLAMEFVEGEPLSKVLKREGRLAPVRAAEVIRQIAEALGAAHSHGILHRDLKPDNVMVGHTRYGADLVKLVDFGIARSMERSTTREFTSTGFVVGTPDYMSPEQLSGENLDARSDQYALGLIAYRLFSGAGAYPDGHSAETLAARLTRPPRRLSDVAPDVAWPDALQAVLDQSLAVDPSQRYPEALAFAEAVGQAAAQLPLTEEDQAYLSVLSRNPTPVRSAAFVDAFTPPHGAHALATPTPTNPTLSLPDAEQTTRIATPRRSRPWLVPLAAIVVAGGVFAVLKYSGGASEAPIADTTQTSLALGVIPADSTAPTTADSAGARAVADSTSVLTATQISEIGRNATVAVWVGERRGTAVLVGDRGLALTSSALAPTDGTPIDVFLDVVNGVPARVRAQVIRVDAASGVAAIALPTRSCRRCATLTTGASDFQVRDSVFLFPSNTRAVGPPRTTTIREIRPRNLVLSGLRNALGAPVVHARSGELIGLVTQRGSATVVASATALNDLLVPARAAAAPQTSDALLPTWPAQGVPVASLRAADKLTAEQVNAYVTTRDDISVLAMTPPIIKWRDDQGGTPKPVDEIENPFLIEESKRESAPSPPTAAIDPIRRWRLWSAYVAERRAVVLLNASPTVATFPRLPTGTVKFGRRGDVKAVRLLRDGQPVPAIDSATYDAVPNAAAYRQGVYSSALSAYSAFEFRNSAANYEAEVVDAKQNTTVRVPITPGMVQAIQRDFAWLFR